MAPLVSDKSKMKLHNPYLTTILSLFLITTPAILHADDNPKSTDTVPEVLAKVNGSNIYRHELTLSLPRLPKRHDPSKKVDELSPAEERAAARKQRQDVLDKLIDRQLLCEEAERRNIAVPKNRIEAQWKMARRQIERGGAPTDDVDEKLSKSGFTEKQYKDEIRKDTLAQMLRKELIPKPESITDKEIEICYNKFKERYRVAPKVHFKELLIALPRFAGKGAVDAANERANTIQRKLDSGTDFDTLIRQYSDAVSAKNGGDSGWKTRAKLGNETANIIFSLKPGQIGGPIKTATGLVLVKLIEKRDAEYHTIEEANESIINFLRQQKGNANIDELIKKLRSSAKIELLVRP